MMIIFIVVMMKEDTGGCVYLLRIVFLVGQ